jgi:hypothetical protein
MNKLLTLIRREPVLLVTLVGATLAAAVTFGAPITAPEKTAVDGVLVALAAVITRSQVTPVSGQ